MTNTVVQDNLTMTGILQWLTEKHKVKKSGEPFYLSDIQGYIGREQIPEYLGGYKIIKKEEKYSKLYKLVENNG